MNFLNILSKFLPGNVWMLEANVIAQVMYSLTG